MPSPFPVLIHPLNPLTLRLPLPHFTSVTISLPVRLLLRLSQAQFLLLLHIITQSCYAICLSVSLMVFADIFLSFTFISSSVRVMSSLTHKCTHTQTPLLCVYAVVVMHGQSWSLVLAHVDGRLSLPPKCFGNTGSAVMPVQLISIELHWAGIEMVREDKSRRLCTWLSSSHGQQVLGCAFSRVLHMKNHKKLYLFSKVRFI